MNGVCTLLKSTTDIGNSIAWNIVGVGGGGSPFSVIWRVSVVGTSAAPWICWIKNGVQSFSRTTEEC